MRITTLIECHCDFTVAGPMPMNTSRYKYVPTLLRGFLCHILFGCNRGKLPSPGAMRPYREATASISTRAFLGSVFTAKQALAGGAIPSNDFAAHTPTLDVTFATE